MPRTLKQILYGFFFLSLIVIFGFGSYQIFLKPQATCFDNKLNQKEEGVDCGGPCIPCELKSLELIDEEIQVFRAGGRSTFLVKVTNPSQNYGLRSFNYNLEIFGPFGFRLTTLEKKSTIYPGEMKYLVVAGVDIEGADVSTVKFNVLNPEWEPKQNFPTYEIKIEKVETTLSDSAPEVSGQIVNKSALNFPRVKLMALLLDKEERIVSASETEISLNLESAPAFKIFFPKLTETQGIEAKKTQVFWEIIPD